MTPVGPRHRFRGSAGGAFPYDARRTPPAPVVPIRLAAPQAEPTVALVALVDSGADLTVLPEGLPDAIGLPQIGVVTVRGVGGVVRRVPVYAAQIEVAGTRRIVEAAVVGDAALLGRDVLNRWVVTLDGPRLVMRVRAP